MLSYQFSYNGVTFNDLASIQARSYISLISVSGLSSPEIIHREDRLVGQHGIIDYYSFIGKRIITLEGGMVAMNESDMLAKLKEFTDAFSIPAVPTDDRTGYHNLVMTKSGESSKYISAKINTMPRIEKQMHIHRMRRFFVELRCEDPRILSSILHSDTLLKSYKLGSLPAALPMLLGVDGAWENTVDILNDGNFGALPTITINGPCVNPKITNDSYPDIYQEFLLTLVAGESIVIDTKNGTATKSDGTNVLVSETDESQWIVLMPGNNTLRFTSADVDPDGSVAIEWRDTWLSVPR